MRSNVPSWATPGAALPLLFVFLATIAPTAGAQTDGRLVEDWSVGVDADVLVGRPVDVAWAADGVLHVLDSELNCVHVFGPEGDPRGSFGAEGDGPGEFRNAPSLFVDGEGATVVVQSMPLRLVRFSSSGAVLGEVTLDDGVGGIRVVTRMEAVGVHFVYEELQTTIGTEGMGTALRLVTFDRERGTRTVLVDHERSMGPSKRPLYEQDNPSFLGRWCMTARGEVAYVSGFERYEGTIVSLDGAVEREVTREGVTARARGEDELEAIRARRLANSRTGTSRFQPSPVARVLYGVHRGPDGQLWWMRDPGSPDDDFALVFDRFDAAGVFLGTSTVDAPADLRDRRLVIEGDRLVALPVAKNARPDDDGPAPALLRVFRIEVD